MKFDIVTRLRNPPFGTETSERNIMDAAAAEIERLREALVSITKQETPYANATVRRILITARAALPKGGERE